MNPRGRRRWNRVVIVAAAALLGGTIAPAAVAQETPGVDEIVHSPNMRQLANIPKQAPFDTEQAFGTDIAFTDDHAIVGNYDGFTVYDISKPKKPRIVSQVVCPGGQNDVSVSGDLLFLSTDYARTNDSCTSEPAQASDPDSWEGIKVFDISDLSAPEYVAAVRTDCGSHTHTMVPDPSRGSVFVYVSSYSPAPELPNCQPPHDKISIVEVPVDSPEDAEVVATPVLFPDGGNPGGDNPDGTRRSATTGCHDLTAYPEKNLMAGACMGDGVLFDLSDKLNPRVLDRVQDNENFAFWHSATFNNSGTKVVFTDELGGGGLPTCNARFGPNRGADGIYDITGEGVDKALEFRSYYKIPRHQTETENCVAHNGSLIPVAGRDIMVQSWYQGGVSVWDFTDSANPKEIGYWERGPLSDTQPITGGTWSAYYYNGHVYSSDIQKGLDVLAVNDPRTAPAKSVRYDEFNAQTQPSYGRG
ncbi:LVIVD repeat-containing protein [Prauserella oleivorans]|uniref:LVIVD repeat-containing protein n=1 Tax=Prauserella oleivorans TaxID=1478153 RepID=A0ABW5W868_9PSEU